MIEIENGLVLNNPTMKIKSIQYEQFDNLVNVECYFVEENSNFTHSRNYTFQNVGGLDLIYSDVIELMRSNELLNSLI
jgi:hypothetical protein